MRHCVRTLLTFTRPYFGTASSMSKTLAVWVYSGGWSSSVWIDARPLLRSRLSCARRERTTLALSRASRRWVSDRSGAAECLVAVLVAGGTRAPILHLHFRPARLIRRICIDLHLRSSFVHIGRRCSRNLQGFQLVADARAGIRVTEGLGSDGDERGTRAEQVAGVVSPCYAAHPDDRDRDSGGDESHLCKRDRADRGARQSAGPAAEPGLRGARRQRHRAQRVDERDGVRAGLLGRLGDGSDIGGIGGQLHHWGLSRGRADPAHRRPPRSGGRP